MTMHSAPRAGTATVLLLGFEPFGDDDGNPGWDAVRLLDGEQVDGRRIVSARLPVAFGESLRQLHAHLDRLAPELVIAVGLAGGRSRLSLERVAINVDDARIPDNAGACPIDCAVVDEGPAAYFTTLPIKAMLAALGEAGIPAEVSQSAGTYVCNHVFYGLMHALRDRPGVRGGFIHVPYSPAQATRRPGAPSLPADTVAEGLRIAVHAALETDQDLRIGAGAVH
jgi:pyroglutamyl-peptidase